MKVLLADPPQLFLEGRGLTRQVQPLGLGYIGAYLARDHDVRFLLPDTAAYEGDDPWNELRGAITREAPDLVGLTCVTATYGSARKLASIVKSVDRSIVTVLGSRPRSRNREEARTRALHTISSPSMDKTSSRSTIGGR